MKKLKTYAPQSAAGRGLDNDLKLQDLPLHGVPCHGVGWHGQLSAPTCLALCPSAHSPGFVLVGVHLHSVSHTEEPKVRKKQFQLGKKKQKQNQTQTEDGEGMEFNRIIELFGLKGHLQAIWSHSLQ